MAKKVFNRDRSYVIGRLKKGASPDVVRPEFYTKKELSGERICDNGCKALGDLFDANPFGLQNKQTWYVYERQENGDLRYMGADTPQAKQRMLADGVLPDGTPTGGRPQLSPLDPLFDDPTLPKNRPAYRDHIDSLEKHLDHERDTVRSLSDNVRAVVDQNGQMMEQMKEMVQTVREVDKQNITLQSKLEMELMLAKLRQDLKSEAKQEAIDELESKQGGGLSDFIPGLDWGTLFSNLPSILAALPHLKGLFSDAPPAAGVGAPEPTPEQMAAIQAMMARNGIAVPPPSGGKPEMVQAQRNGVTPNPASNLTEI